MAGKILNTRIQLKYDTLANWQSSAFNGNDPDKYLKTGEVAVVQVETNIPNTLAPVMFKVGTGDKKFDDLEWASAKAADVYGWAKAAHLKIDVTEAESTNDGQYVNGLVWDENTHTLKPQMVSFDTTITATSTNAPTTQAIKAYVDEEVGKAVSGGVEGLATKSYVDGEVEKVQKQINELDNTYATDEELGEVREIAEAARTEDEVNSQIDTKITALNLGTTYEPIGAEARAKAYADGLITDANLGQYTTEQEVKDIVDGVIAGAADSETYNSLTKLVDYIDTHGGEASKMASAIDTLEGKVETIEGKPAYNITTTQVTNWDTEVGAKALAESKTTTAEVKTQIEAYGYATETYADNKAAAAQSAAEATAAQTYVPLNNNNNNTIIRGVQEIHFDGGDGTEGPFIRRPDDGAETLQFSLGNGNIGFELVGDNPETPPQMVFYGSPILSGIAAPINNNDAATKKYVDDAITNQNLATIATSGNVNDLVQTEGEVLIFNCGSASAVL